MMLRLVSSALSSPTKTTLPGGSPAFFDLLLNSLDTGLADPYQCRGEFKTEQSSG